MASNKNRKRGNILSRIVSEMVGKDDGAKFSWFSRSRNPLFTNETTVDYTRNDYELSRSVYMGSVINGNRDAKDMLLGSAFARPIANTAAAFAIGGGFTVSLSIVDEDEDEEASQAVNDWIDRNMSTIYDWTTHGYRDGDSYIYVDELGKTEEFDAKDVEVQLDLITGEVIGYDITEVLEELNPQTRRTIKYKVVKKFRKDSIRYDKYDEHDRFVETIFERVFTINGTITPSETQEFFEGELMERTLPIVHLANDREPRAIYGTSEYQNVYIYMKEYHRVLDSATKGVIYNGTPIPVFKGISDTDATGDDSQRSSMTDKMTAEDEREYGKGKMEWGQDSAIYIDGEGDAFFLQANAIMGDVDSLLKRYFQLIIEASETPEYVFGTAVQSSLASTETQTPVMLQKTERKRTKLRENLSALVKVYIDRQIRLSNPLFLKFKEKEVNVDITFPELMNEDKTLTLATVTMLIDRGIVTEQTALELLLDSRIKDPVEEIKNARAETEEANKRNQIMPEQPSRVEDLLKEELDGQTDKDKARARKIAADADNDEA